MGLLRLSVLGAPEVFHDGSRLAFSLRKAQALLLYLAVEGGTQLRSKLAAFLWPDSEPHDARTALRNALALLRTLLNDTDASPAAHCHLLSTPELLGLNPRAPLEMDLDLVQQAYHQAQGLPTLPSEEQRGPLITQWQHALSLVRGPFLDGFWLREETPFDEWVQLQQHQWRVRLQLLFDRLSSWHEAALEHEQASAILTRWLALDPLQEEAYRRLMRLHLARGDPNAAWQVYVTCRERLAQELQVEPSPQTVALTERIRAAQARRPSSPSHPSARHATDRAASLPPGELIAPLVGRAASISQLVASFQQAQRGLPQAVLVVGEAGIGKTRLTSEFVAWARSQGADVLSGHAFEVGGRLPYQPLVEAIRVRLEEENAPEDLLDDLWLAELGRLLPELRVRYPDLPPPSEDALITKIHLFEAVARLLDTLAQRAQLVLLLDDLHWADEASLDLLRYLGHYWKEHRASVLLLGTVRSEDLALNPQLSVQLADLGRDLPLTHVTLQMLSQAETFQALESLVAQGEAGTSRAGEPSEEGSTWLSSFLESGVQPASVWKSPLHRLGDLLFELTGGQPFYLFETLKLLRERQWLMPRLGSDGTWRLVPDMERIATLLQDQSRRELVPTSVRAMILSRLTKLTPTAHQLVRASAVLGYHASAQVLWQVAELGVQAGTQALEEAVGSGILCEENGGGDHAGSYSCAHEMIHDVVYTELSEARRYVLQQRALWSLRTEAVVVAEPV